MALDIQTFSNRTGGATFFKAIGHPKSARLATALLDRLGQAGPVAIYDPLGHALGFAALYDLGGLDVVDVFVQRIEDIGTPMFGRTAQPVTDLKGSVAKIVFIPSFDAKRLSDNITHLVPDGATVVTLDEIRLDRSMQTVSRTYLAPLNFATNFAFFRDEAGHHTRLVTANYWAGYGASAPRIWFCLFDAEGTVLAEWQEELGPANGTIVVDSAEIRARFGLPDFCGQLFLHVLGGAGHDIVKYALDTYGDDEAVLSCTHDANAWPADRYAGLPAPKDGETVNLWIQNSHPRPIPAGSVGLNRMGRDDVRTLDREIPAFGSYKLDVSDLLPGLAWPEQIEIRAGKHFVRPRYEATTQSGRLRISHPNVERSDLEPDPKIPELSNLMGKGFILPAPILPTDRFRSHVMPTPMSTAQQNLPLALIAFDGSGQEILRHRFGCLPRDHSSTVDVAELIAQHGPNGLTSGYGHLELVYDFADGGEADGWLHGLFRYEDRASGHVAETSFGAHIFNTVLVHRNEPQSYVGQAPGLSTRLFLRLGRDGDDTLCHLIYPASTPWNAASDTTLHLTAATGEAVASRTVNIPCSGSYLFRSSELFTADERAAAGPDAYILIRDVTCRLFGYHGLARGEASFSLDHMFGF